MTTSPIRIIHTGPVPISAAVAAIASGTVQLVGRRPLDLAAAMLLWIAAALAITATLLGHLSPWMQITVAVMLTIGTVALAAAHYRDASRRLDAAIKSALER